MTFASSNLTLMNEQPMVGGGSTPGSTALSPAQWYYASSDSSTSIAATGYFAGMGVGSRGGSPKGMRVGDLVTNVENAAGNTPGRVTVHSIKTSSANQSSTTGSTGYGAAYDLTASSTP